MNEKEKEAVKYFYNLRATIDESNMLFGEDIIVKCGKEMIKQITIVLNLLEKKDKENKELKTITNQYEAYECEAPKGSKAKIIIADKFYFNNGYFKDNFIELDKIKAKIEELVKEEKENLKGTKGHDRYAIKQEYINKRSILQELLKEGEI